MRAILTNVKRLYDGTAGAASAVRERVDIVLDGGRIEAVRPHDPAARADGAATIDGSRYTATPGLVDCHAHVTVVGLSSADLDRTSGGEGILLAERVLYRTLVDGGVTTARDVGGATHLLKRLVDEGRLIGPRLKVAICMLSTTGGHADFRGRDRCHDAVSRLFPPGPGRPSSIVDGPWDCRKRVREIAACGADVIKICASPGIASPTDHLEHREFTADEIEAICEEAASRGLTVAAHAHSKGGIELAIGHGVKDIQHVSFMDERLAAMAKERGCVVTPTSWIMRALLEAEGLDPFILEKARKAGEVHAAAVRHARAAGVPILAGTDPVLPGMHGRNYMEMAHLVKDGLPPLEAWHAMTGRAAEAVGQPDAGTLAPGQRADVLLWSDDVLADPSKCDAGTLVEVVKDGVGYRGAIGALPQRTFRDTTDVWGRRE